MSLPILYSFRRCPYAMRARLALRSSSQEVELREIVLRDKAPEFLAASPKATVPVLVLQDGQVVEESYDIMQWALGRSDPDNWLGHAGDATLIAAADGDFKANLDRYKYASRYQGVDGTKAREAAAQFLVGLEARLATTAFLLGPKETLADAAIAPFVRQYANVDRAWFDSQKWPQLIAWLERFLASDSFLSIMQKYPKWRAGDAVTHFP